MLPAHEVPEMQRSFDTLAILTERKLQVQQKTELRGKDIKMSNQENRLLEDTDTC